MTSTASPRAGTLRTEPASLWERPAGGLLAAGGAVTMMAALAALLIASLFAAMGQRSPAGLTGRAVVFAALVTAGFCGGVATGHLLAGGRGLVWGGMTRVAAGLITGALLLAPWAVVHRASAGRWGWSAIMASAAVGACIAGQYFRRRGCSIGRSIAAALAGLGVGGLAAVAVAVQMR